ncbi:MAG: Crp/Fnr family transcriptional regulator [Magnetococcales bacterium]|nr:Crp/Fnr family transcriptional regulator [Magnetococcales bacterium]
MQIERILQNSMLFAPLSAEQWNRLRTGICCRDVARNHFLFHQGQPFTHFFFLHEGLVKLGLSSEIGYEKTVNIIRPGETFATALMFLDRKSYLVSAQMLQPSRVISIDAALFRRILIESPALCLNLLGQMSQKLNQHLGHIGNGCLRNAQSRVARYLMEQLPHDPYRHHVIQLEVPKQVLASLLSITPETLSRVLGEFERKKIIRMHHRQIQVLNLEMLQEKGGLCPGEERKTDEKINHELFV